MFIHGSGVQLKEESIAPKFEEYWGPVTGFCVDCYCSRTYFLKLDTWNHHPYHPSLLTKLKEMVMQTAAIVEESDGASFLIDNTIFITHGTADMSLKAMQVKENVAFGDHIFWISIGAGNNVQGNQWSGTSSSPSLHAFIPFHATYAISFN